MLTKQLCVTSGRGLSKKKLAVQRLALSKRQTGESVHFE